jgi:putative peptidoglycan lipid II flippase
VKVLAPAFYATDMARIAVIASVTAVAGNLILNVTLHGTYGYRVLAFGTAAAAILNFTVLYHSFHKHITRIPHAVVLGHVLRVALAGLVMGAAVWASHRGLASQISSASLGRRAALAFVPILVGIVVYAGACAALRIEEVSHYWGKLRRRR